MSWGLPVDFNENSILSVPRPPMRCALGGGRVVREGWGGAGGGRLKGKLPHNLSGI